jgi:hypothetical protein
MIVLLKRRVRPFDCNRTALCPCFCLCLSLNEIGRRRFLCVRDSPESLICIICRTSPWFPSVDCLSTDV